MSKDEEKAQSANEKIKVIVFKLKNFLDVDSYAEEFIQQDGLKLLINIIMSTSTNTRVNI